MANKFSYLDKSIEYLKGVGPNRAELFKKELGIYRYGDLLMNFPFRYVDRTAITAIKDIPPESKPIQLKGKIVEAYIEGQGRKKRLTATLEDPTGHIQLIWFRGIKWIQKILELDVEFIVFGKVSFFNKKANIPHPEIEKYSDFQKSKALGLAAVYHSTEKLNSRGITDRLRRKMVAQVLDHLPKGALSETLPTYLIENQKLLPRRIALEYIHRPPNARALRAAEKRLKYEELFLLQLLLIKKNMGRKSQVKGLPLTEVGHYFKKFYTEVLPFTLTSAQKRVVQEIQSDLKSGSQMNRLLQGDVGSGKTIVSLMSILIAWDSGYQSCLMAPTEILARQHYNSFQDYCDTLGISIHFLSGSVKGKKRKEVLEAVAKGESALLIGTHAVIEDPVIFKKLGLVIIDEQHRFGVAQRARLWAKAPNGYPHVLVMTATPIPRTLAMTSYGDIDISVIDELPPGRKPVTTLYKRESHRHQVIDFMHKQIALGRQIYVVFPLIEESAQMDLENLQDGYERLLQYFPRPDYQIAVVHGRMKPEDKEREMLRFKKGKTHIMVATTVIEVGVNVPNATVMVIENAERFGLSQLHQLRGRVGRGAEKSYCILMTGYKVSKDGKTRIATMCRTNDGFEIARTDLELRGPGNIQGTQQSGTTPLKMADLIKDGALLEHVRSIARLILKKDPELIHPQNAVLKHYVTHNPDAVHNWSKIG